jgi:photosystem II stability/assembly factor-like uncharacterized protein
MRSLILTLAIISFSVVNSYPQSAWFWQNPVPTGEQIYSVIFQNTDKGFAVGYGGEILKSSNGGMNWLQQASPSTKDLNDIHIINTGLGFICGDSGIVLKTENAGQTWTEIQTPTFNMLESIWCVNDEIIIAAGNFGTVLRSTDRGNSWSKIFTGITNNLRDICFVNSDSGVIVGYGGYLLRTTNSGENWSAGYISTYFLSAVTFLNSTTGLAVSGTNIFKTYNFGGSWTTVNSGYDYSLNDVTYLDSTTAIAVGSNSMDNGTFIFRSTNSGNNWTNVGNSSTSTFLYSVCKVDNNVLSITGSRVFMRSTNRGASWTTVSSRITGESLSSVDFSDPLRGTIVGYNSILRTTNGGNNWVPQTISGGINTYLNCVDFVNANTGTIVGSTPYIYRTTNGGSNWIPQFHDNGNALNSVQLLDENYGAACGTNETILRTTNGGINWITQKHIPNSGIAYDDIFFTNASTGFTVGLSAGNILKTTNGGTNWNIISTGATNSLSSVYFVNDLTGFISGGSVILKSTNAGENWSACFSYTGVISSLFFTDSQTGYATSKFTSSFYRTTNAGISWTSHHTGTTRNLEDIFFTNSSTGWIVANGGTILKTTNSGLLVSVETKNLPVINDFGLFQNYPNPFNPTTIISYKLNTNSFVSIRIFDIRGRLITTLYEENKNPGSYKTEWNAGSESSGVYFYSLFADGKFIGVRSMVLLK